MTNMSFRIKKL